MGDGFGIFELIDMCAALDIDVVLVQVRLNMKRAYRNW